MSWYEVVGLLPLRLLPDLRQTPGCISACAWPLGLELLKALQQPTTTGRCGDLEQRQWRVWKGGSLDSSNCTSGCLTKLSELSQLDILVGGFMAKELLATSL